MAFDFPNSPTTDQLFEPSGGPKYKWTGQAWAKVPGTDPGGGGGGAVTGVSVVIDDASPSSPTPNSFWWESDTGYLFLRFPNAGTPAWVQVNGLPDAPVDGQSYSRRNASWVVAASGGGGGGIAEPVSGNNLRQNGAWVPGLPLAGGTLSGPLVLAADPNADMQAATMRYVDASIGSGMMGFFDYTFNGSSYTPPPIAGNFRMNNANQTLATHIYLHEQTAPGNDAALLLAQAISVGDKFLIQKKTDATKWRRYTITAISDAGTYWDFTVTYVDGGAALDNARTAIIVQKASGGGGGVGSDWPLFTGGVTLDGGTETAYFNILTRGATNYAQTGFNIFTKSAAWNDWLGSVTSKGWQFVARGDAWSGPSEQNDFVLSFWNSSAWAAYMSIDSVTGLANFPGGLQSGGVNVAKVATISTSAPSGGVDGDVWYQVP